MSDILLSAIDQVVQNRYGEGLQTLEDKIRNLQFANDDLRKKVCSEVNRSQRFASLLGFDDLNKAELAVAARPYLWNVNAVERSQCHSSILREELEKQVCMMQKARAVYDGTLVEITAVKRDYSRTVEENYRLILERDQAVNESAKIKATLEIEVEKLEEFILKLIDMSEHDDQYKNHPSEDLQLLTKSMASGQIDQSFHLGTNAEDNRTKEDLRMQLSILTQRHETTVVSMKRAAQKYKVDYRKWKLFKEYFVANMMKKKHAKSNGSKASPRNVSSDVMYGEEELISVVDGPFITDVKGRGVDVEGKGMEGHPTSLFQSNFDSLQSPAKNRAAQISSGSTKGQGQMSHPSFTAPINVTSCHANEYNPSDCYDMSLKSSTGLSLTCGENGKTSPLSVTLPQRSQQEINKGNIQGQSVFTEVLEEESMDEYQLKKGQGRYSNSSERTKEGEINALYEINASKNDGLRFQFDAVVRNKAKRRRLDAGDCECCREYYSAIGPLPPRLQAPMWISPSSPEEVSRRTCDHHREVDTAMREDVLQSDHSAKAIEERKRDISRHRHQWAPPSTPPDYWSIGFPTTQEVADINKKAEGMHSRKKRQVQNEANKCGGRYTKRT